MKLLKLIKTVGIVIALVGFIPETGTAQSTTASCDTCTTPWGPVQRRVYYNQTINGLLPSCLYNVYLDIQTRVCGGKIQVRLLEEYIEALDTSTSCTLACFHVGALMEKISKLLLVDLGGNIVLNKPSSCYYLLEFALTPALRSCLGGEADLFKNWYTAIPCDTTGCCVTEYILQPDGSVRTVTSVSTPCMGTPPSSVPTSITIYCWTAGVRNAYIVPVVPPTTPLTCEVSCSTTGYIFTARKAEEQLIENKASAISAAYPNPTDGLISFDAGTGVRQVSLFDINGKKILNYAGERTTVNLHSMISGTYLLVVEHTDGQQKKYTVIRR